MKKSVTLLVVILIPVLLVITGCSKPAVPATAPAAAATTASETAPAAALTEAPVAATAAPTEVSNDAQMEALILEKLQGHHSIDVVLSANKTREEWVRTLDRMIAKGAVISDEEKTLIIDWLLSRKNYQ